MCMHFRITFQQDMRIYMLKCKFHHLLEAFLAPHVQIYSPIHSEGYCVPIALMFYIVL